MGAWGVKALESDEGLDLVDLLGDCYLPEHTVMQLEEIIELLKKEGLFGVSFEKIDFLYDNNAMALTELYLEWLDTGKLDYVDSEEESTSSWAKVTAFTASTAALDFLLRYLYDIKNEVPDADGEREIVELWRDNGENPNWEEWSHHLDRLIARIEELKKEERK